jgi:hypothetical protein
MSRVGQALARTLVRGLLLLVLASCFPFAQAADRGVINDPDGYVNVRRDKSTASPVVAKVKDNEPFTFEPDEGMEWCKVKLRSGQTGWMHSSRIRLYFTEAELPQKPKKGEGVSEIDEHALRVTGIAYPTLARKAAQDDRDAQKKFFGLAETVDGAAAESFPEDVLTMVHLLGDNKLAAFLATQPVSFLVGVRGRIFQALESPAVSPQYANLHFPKTTALLLRRELVDWPSPDGRFAIRKVFSNAEDLSISKVTRAELIEKATGKVVLDLTSEDIGTGSEREGNVLWAPDSKRFAYLSMDLQVREGNLFANPPPTPTKKQTVVYADAGTGFAKVELPLSEPPGRKDDPELKRAVVGHEYIEPLSWKKPNVLVLQRHDYFRALRPDNTIVDLGRLWEITVTFSADGKPDVKWKRDEHW